MWFDILATLWYACGVAGPTSFYTKDTKVVKDLHVDDFHVTGPRPARTILLSERGRYLLLKVSCYPGVVDSEYEYLPSIRRRHPEPTPSQLHREAPRRVEHARLSQCGDSAFGSLQANRLIRRG